MKLRITVLAMQGQAKPFEVQLDPMTKSLPETLCEIISKRLQDFIGEAFSPYNGAALFPQAALENGICDREIISFSEKSLKDVIDECHMLYSKFRQRGDIHNISAMPFNIIAVAGSVIDELFGLKHSQTGHSLKVSFIKLSHIEISNGWPTGIPEAAIDSMLRGNHGDLECAMRDILVAIRGLGFACNFTDEIREDSGKTKYNKNKKRAWDSWEISVIKRAAKENDGDPSSALPFLAEGRTLSELHRFFSRVTKFPEFPTKISDKKGVPRIYLNKEECCAADGVAKSWNHEDMLTSFIYSSSLGDRFLKELDSYRSRIHVSPLNGWPIHGLGSQCNMLDIRGYYRSLYI